ncbi:hypothetical protein [Methylocystis iwaonis]|uniref:hypothetical protein n=1 Tax=Methylocystis iwaonis TaxID=2885079 RepID=UPI002E7B592A|nr:hypothetical protein [Methylocystis iwaonis]
MQLRKKFLEPRANAGTNYVQIGHRRTAIEYALAGIKRHHDAVLEAVGQDPFTQEMEGTMRAWVAETLLQGAYLREYHLWEKDCKAYFPEMAQRNGGTLVMKTKPGQPFTSLVWDTLARFSVTVTPNITSAIEAMRDRVNVMKHEAGLELDHFISEADYTAGVEALEEFWNHLASAEKVGP